MPIRQRTSIFWAIFSLIGGIGGAAFVASATLLARDSEDRFQAELHAALRSYLELQVRDVAVLRAVAALAADDPRIKPLLATPGIDSLSLLDAAAELQRSTGVELLVLLDQAGEPLAGLGLEPQRLVAEGPLLALAREGGASSGLLVHGDATYTIHIQRSAYDARTVGFVVTGRRLDRRYLDSAAELVGGVVVVHGGGALLVASGSRSISELPSTDGVAELVAGDRLHHALTARLGRLAGGGQALITVARPPPSWAAEETARTLLRLGLVACVALLVAVVGAAAVAGSISARLERLADRSRQIAGGGLALRADPRGSHEVQTLASSINALAEQVCMLLARTGERRQAPFRRTLAAGSANGHDERQTPPERSKT